PCIRFIPLVTFMTPRTPTPTLSPYTTLFRSCTLSARCAKRGEKVDRSLSSAQIHLVQYCLLAMKLVIPGETGQISAILCRAFSQDRKSTRLNSSHEWISYAVFCLKKKTSMSAVFKMLATRLYWVSITAYGSPVLPLD